MSPSAPAPVAPADWDVARPAMPEDLFRTPVEEHPDGGWSPPPTGPVPTSDAFDPDATAVRPVAPPTMAMPVPPYPPGSPEADLLPSERPYAPPLSPAPRQGRSHGARGVIILLVLLVLAAIAGGVLWFTGGGSPAARPAPSKTTSVSASSSKAGSAPAQGSSLPPSVPASAAPSDAFPPSGATLCTGSTTVAVNGTTSCEFAMNVAAAIPQGSTGGFTVTASSPVTQKDYQMTCVRGSYTVCSGGVNAVVYVK